jgi:hypothetical protein
MARDDWKTAKGSRVSVESDRHGDFIVCRGCGKRIKVTGAGPVIFAVRQHTASCTR